MKSLALQVGSDDPGHFRWVLLHVDGERVLEHSQAHCEFDSYEAALNAGTLALAAADGDEYENVAADPAGNPDCSELDQADARSQLVTDNFAGLNGLTF